MARVCKRCKVEIDQDVEICPLCDVPLGGSQKSTVQNKKYPDQPVEDIHFHQKYAVNRMDIFELTSVTVIFLGLIVLITDLMINQTISWSKYPILSLILFWSMASFPLIFKKRYFLIGVGEVSSLISFLAILDLFIDGKITWFVDLALPIILIVSISTAIVLIINSQLKHRSLNMISILLFGSSILCTGLDLIITNYLYGTIFLSWSIYVIVPSTLVGLFFLYIHYRFITDERLKNRLKAKFMV